MFQVVPISGLRVRAATQTLLVGNPSPIWIEAIGLTATSLGALSPLPRVTFSVRDPTTARLYTSHVDGKIQDLFSEPSAFGTCFTLDVLLDRRGMRVSRHLRLDLIYACGQKNRKNRNWFFDIIRRCTFRSRLI